MFVENSIINLLDKSFNSFGFLWLYFIFLEYFIYFKGYMFEVNFWSLFYKVFFLVGIFVVVWCLRKFIFLLYLGYNIQEGVMRMKMYVIIGSNV